MGDVAIREQALARFYATWSAGLDDVETQRTVDAAMDPDRLPAAIQMDGGHQRAARDARVDQMTGRVTVGLFVTAATGAELPQALNALYARVVRPLMADPTLDGLVSDVRELGLSDPQPMTEGQERPFMYAELDFEFEYETAEDDPTEPA